MAIVNMKKLTLAAPQGERDEILNSIQSIGCVEIVDLKNEQIEVEGAKLFKQSKTISQTQVDYNHVKFTYEFLKVRIKEKNSLLSKREVISKKEFDSLESTIEWNKIYLEAKNIDDSLNSKKTEKSKLITQMEQYQQWTGLDVNENDLKSLKKVSYFVGTVQKKFEDKLLDELSNIGKEIYIEKIFEKQQDVGILVICYKDYVDNVREILKKYGFLKLNLELNDTPQNIVNDIDNKIHKIACIFTIYVLHALCYNYKYHRIKS